METIAKLIELALVECYGRDMIDWLPGDGEPETFNAECEIELSCYNIPGAGFTKSNDWFVILCGVFVIIDAKHLYTWHSSRIHDERICATNPCDYCVA